MPATASAPVRSGQSLDYEGLRLEAAQAIEDYAAVPGQTQADLARALGYTPAYISRAKVEAGAKIAKVQMELIAHLTDYTVEEEVEVSFRVSRKDRPAV